MTKKKIIKKIKRSKGPERSRRKSNRSKFPSALRLDIACGQNKTKDYFGVDIAKTKDVDLVYDLEKFPWPFADNSVSDAVCNHYIEHTKDLIKFMDEVYRILKPGCKIAISAPYYNSIRAWQDPTHTRVISEATFLYFNKAWRVANKLDHYPIKSNFDFTYGYSISPEWMSRAEEARGFAIRHYTNVVDDIQVLLIKKVDKKSTKKG